MDNKGNVIYRCDESNPIVIVMVDRDATESHVLPSRGGYELHEGQWSRVAPSAPEPCKPRITFRLHETADADERG